MPTVPVMNAPRVKATGYSGNLSVDIPRGAFGENIAAGLEDVSGELAKTADRLFTEDGETQANERMSAARREVLALGTDDGGFYSLEGGAAVDAYPGYLDEVSKIYKKHGDGLQNSVGQRKYQNDSEAYMLREDEEGSSFVAKNRKIHQLNVRKETIEINQEEMAAHPYDNAPMMDNIVSSVTAVAIASGLNPDVPEEAEIIKKMAQDAIDVGHGAAIDSFLERQDPQNALLYLEKAIKSGVISDNFAGEKRSEVEGSLNLRVSMDFVDQFAGMGLTKTQLSKKIRDAYQDGSLTAEQRVMAEQRATSLVTNETASRTKYQDSLETKFANYLEANPGSTHQDLQREFASEWATLDPRRREFFKGGTLDWTDTDVQTELVGYLGMPDMNSEEIREIMDKYTDEGKLGSTFRLWMFDHMQAGKQGTSAAESVGGTPRQRFDLTMGNFLETKPQASAPKALSRYKKKYAVLLGLYEQRQKEWLINNPRFKTVPNNDLDEMLLNLQWGYTRKHKLSSNAFAQATWGDSFDKRIDVTSYTGAELEGAQNALIERGLSRETITTREILGQLNLEYTYTPEEVEKAILEMRDGRVSPNDLTASNIANWIEDYSGEQD